LNQNGGNVGIGTTSPIAKLHVEGNTYVGTNQIQFQGASSGINRIQSFAGNVFGKWQFKTSFDDIILDAGENANNLRKINFRIGGSDKMLITENGNVGIGVTNPQSKLEVSAGNRLAVGFTYVDNTIDLDNGYTRSSIGSNAYWDSNTNLWNVTAIGANDFSAMIHPNGNGLAFITAPSDGNASKTLTNSQFMAFERMRISSNGNVGIGTTVPDTKLAVKGTIHAQEVKVDLNVPAPDYVFEPTYNLKPLAEIETYIKANKHLPEVPSAKEMETNGVQLGEMNMLLLKKVEELTLHLIEKDRQFIELKAEVEALKKSNTQTKK
jgi:hypothetical protein